MKHCRLVSQRATISALTLIAAGLLAPAVFAQQDGAGAPPPGGGQGGGGQRGGGRGGRGQRGGRGLTVADIPVSALDAELKLTADQKTKIATIQKPYMAQRKAMMAMMPQPGGPPPAQPVDRDAMMANFQKMRTAGEQAVADITAVLTDAQKAALPDAIKELNGLQPGVPLELYAGLALTPDEKTGIADANQKMSRRWRTESQDAQGDPGAMADALAKWQKDTKREIENVLTDSQKATYEQYLKDHPDAIRPPMGGGFGGGGRRGGGGGGGFGGGGQGGPPPPGA